MIDILELQRKIYDNAASKGFHDKHRSDGEIIGLIHTELSEALEELRNGHQWDEIYYNETKPEGYLVELADAVIRVFDYFGSIGYETEAPVLLGDISMHIKNFPAYCHKVVSKAYKYQRDIIKPILLEDLIHVVYSFFEFHNKNLFDVIELKHNFNVTREYLHGKVL